MRRRSPRPAAGPSFGTRTETGLKAACRTDAFKTDAGSRQGRGHAPVDRLRPERRVGPALRQDRRPLRQYPRRPGQGSRQRRQEAVSTVRCVCFTTSGAWICLTNNGWWTSDLNHPASKMIADLDKQHRSLRWVAVAPRSARTISTNGRRIIHRAMRRETPRRLCLRGLAGEGKVVAKGAEGWARAPWEKEHPSVKWTVDKPMGVASVSKTITAVSLLKLWEETGQEVLARRGVLAPHQGDLSRRPAPTSRR